MRRCIYSGIPLQGTDRDAPDFASDDHIISLALGGCDSFTTNDVSRKWNNRLATDLENRFADQTPVAVKRVRYDLRGHSNEPPSVRLTGASQSDGRPWYLETRSDGAVKHWFKPQVERDVQTGRYTVSGLEGENRRSIENLIQKSKRRGEILTTKDGQPIQTYEDAVRGAIDEPRRTVHGEFPLDFELWARFFLKVAIGFGHVVLGSDWTFSASGDRLRSVLHAAPPGPFGSEDVTLGTPPEVQYLIDSFKWSDEPHHTLLVLPRLVGQFEPIALISMFEPDDPFSATINLGPDQGRLVAGMGVPEETVVGVQLGLKTRRARWISFAELHRAMFSGAVR